MAGRIIEKLAHRSIEQGLLEPDLQDLELLAKGAKAKHALQSKPGAMVRRVTARLHKLIALDNEGDDSVGNQF
jgi:hypothetical protein